MDQVAWLKFRFHLQRDHQQGRKVVVLLTPPSESFQSYAYRGLQGPGRYGKAGLEHTFKEGVRRETLHHE